MYVHWHRRDLRAPDNRGLVAPDAPVLPLFVLDDEALAHAAPPRVAFLLDALASLRAWYRDRGSDLLIRRGDSSAIVPEVATEYDAEGVGYGHDYSGFARERDEAVRAGLDEKGIDHEGYHDAVLHRPGAIRTNEGDPYSVFSYFWKTWRDREKADPVAPPDADALVDRDDIQNSEIPDVDALGFEAPEANLPAAGTDPARERLAAFCEDDIYRYEEAREYPAEDATSRLSPHLKFGTIGIREVYARTEEALESADTDEERDSVEEFQSQLAWREFYAQVLHFNPEGVTENYRSYENDIEWREAPDELAAWKAGETGYPIVDAGMRQLREEAWMHNRVRMVVASFLTKDLLVDWREGYDWFRERLVDHDTANDNGGWQWAASTGTDAQPYFRIFNPTTQGERYDPDAEYIHEYVPELRDVPAETIHEWPELTDEEREEAALEYPAPIVDHDERREATLAMFERARGED